MLRRLLHWWRYGRRGVQVMHGWEDEEGNLHPSQQIISRLKITYGKGQTYRDN